jgi:hypothetical protein
MALRLGSARADCDRLRLAEWHDVVAPDDASDAVKPDWAQSRSAMRLAASDSVEVDRLKMGACVLSGRGLATSSICGADDDTPDECCCCGLRLICSKPIDDTGSAAGTADEWAECAGNSGLATAADDDDDDDE